MLKLMFKTKPYEIFTKKAYYVQYYGYYEKKLFKILH